MGAPLVLDAAAVAQAMGWVTRGDDPKPRPELVRQLVREGRFPAPIDRSEPVTRWRWSARQVEQYAAGEWRRPAALPGTVTPISAKAGVA